MNNLINLNELISNYLIYNEEKKKMVSSFYSEENKKKQCEEFIKKTEKIKNTIYKLDITRRSYLYMICSDIYIDIIKFDLYKYGYIKDDSWNQPILTNDLDKNKVEKYMKNEMDIIDNFKDNISLYEKNYKEKADNNLLKFDRYEIMDKIRLGYQFIANTYYFVFNDINLFLENAILAVEYNSIQSASLLVKYFCDNEEYDKAYYYFKKCIDIDIYDKDIINNIILKEMMKIKCYSYIYHYLYNIGSYDEAIKIVSESDLFFESLKYVKEADIDELKKENKEFLIKCNKKIEEKQKVKSDDILLIKYFSRDIINIMSDDVKIYIDTSLKIYDYISTNSSTMDYSASLIPIMKGVESVLFEIIALNYLPFLSTKESLDFSLIDNNFKNKGDKFSIVEKIEKLEMGTVLYSIAKINFKYPDKEYIPNKYFFEFCCEKNVNLPEDTIKKFALNLDELKNKRNKVAHKNRVLKDDADEDLDFLLKSIKFIEFLYINFGFCFENTMIK